MTARLKSATHLACFGVPHADRAVFTPRRQPMAIAVEGNTPDDGLMALQRIAIQVPDLVLTDLRVPLPRPAGLLLEKLLTERSGLKGERDLLVALGLLLVSRSEDIDELASEVESLRDDQRRTVMANLALLSLLRPLSGMPDPTEAREILASLMRRLEALR